MTLEEFSLPLCMIPFEESEYRGRVTKLEDKTKENLERLAIEESKSLGSDIILRWDKQLGLKHISNLGGGLDILENCQRYSYHNIYPESPAGQAIFKIAKEYISELKEQ